VTTIGAITGKSMREYLRSSFGKEVSLRAYREVLAAALACGVRLETMIVELMARASHCNECARSHDKSRLVVLSPR
jgi:hypothetical protein